MRAVSQAVINSAIDDLQAGALAVGADLKQCRETLKLSRSQVADALGIMSNDVYRAEARNIGSRSCPDAPEMVRAYLYGLMGLRSSGRGLETAMYGKGDLVHVTKLPGVWRYQYHHTSPRGVTTVTIYGGVGKHVAFRTVTPERLGRIIRKNKQGEDA